MTYNEFDNPEVYIPPGKDTNSEAESALMLGETEDESPSETVAGDLTEEAEYTRSDSSAATQQRPRRRPSGGDSAPILTVEVGDEVETEESREDIIWHEIHNAYRTRRILSGMLSGVEQLENGKTIAVADYKGFRILIPLKEMMILMDETQTRQRYADMIIRQVKLLQSLLGSEIDFMIRGIDSGTRSVVASRQDAVLRKRQRFYFDVSTDDRPLIYPGRIVQARVIAVSEKSIRVEIFGAECSIIARDLAWHWIGDAHEHYAVGDKVLVRIQSITGDKPENLKVKADIRSISQNTSHDNLKKCRVQSRYAGKVTDVRKGVVYIRLNNGVNAIAHSCYDYRTPGKKDDVSFAVTKLDEEQGVAVGIITRIIRQNL